MGVVDAFGDHGHMHLVSSVTSILRRAIAGAVLAAVAGVAVATGAGASWAVVAADPGNGELGYAVATCDRDAVGAALSTAGAVVVDAEDADDLAAEALDRIVRGSRPDAALEVVAAAEVVGAGTSRNGGAAATVGDDRADTGRRSSTDGRVVVVGSDLEDPAVLDRALAAFEERPDLALGDRLLRALEAGSAAGGDARCTTDNVTQTAAYARLAIAGGEDGALDVDRGEGTLGPNALTGLREEYEAARADRYGDCDGCDLGAIDVPEGDVPGRSRRIASFVFTFGTLIVFLIIYRRWRLGLDEDRDDDQG